MHIFGTLVDIDELKIIDFTFLSLHIECMECITRCAVPTYLHDSQFYQSLDPSDDSPLPIPVRCCKKDLVLHASADVDELLSTLRFWGGIEVPIEALDFLMRDESGLCESLCVAYEQELKDWALMVALKKEHPANRIKEAAKNTTRTDILKYLVTTQHAVTSEALECAAMVDNLPYLQYAQQHCRHLLTTATRVAAYHGKLDSLRYLVEHGCRCGPEVMDSAAHGGSLACMQYLYSVNPMISQSAGRIAATCGHLDCLQYAHSKGCIINAEIVGEAATYGHYDCLVFAHEKCNFWHEYTASVIAQHGHLRCLQYATEHGCPKDDRTCTSAAENGHLHCLQYAHKSGYVWDEFTVWGALTKRHYRCAVYAVLHNCPYFTSMFKLVILTGCVVTNSHIFSAVDTAWYPYMYLLLTVALQAQFRPSVKLPPSMWLVKYLTKLMDWILRLLILCFLYNLYSPFL